MKVRKKLLPVVLLIQAVGITLLPFSSLLQPTAHADSTPFQSVFYYPNDSDSPGEVENLIKAFNGLTESGTSPSSSVVGGTYIDIMGGPFGSAPQQLSYDSGATDANSHGFAYALNNGQGYDCYVDGSGNPQLSIPNNQKYWHIDFDMYVTYNIGSDPPTFNYREGITKVDEIQGPNPTLAGEGGAGGAMQLASVSQNNAQGLGAPQLSSVGFPSGCLPDPAYHSSHIFGSTHPLENYYQNEAQWPNITANPAGTGGGGAGAGSEDTCDSNSVSLGWLLCPIITLATGAIDGIIQGVVIPELQVQPLVANSSDSQYVIWGNIRNLADVLFVLVFLVIIFANTLQFNINAYTIKKVIPRLVAAVILVQFSFILSAVIIDIGNILGQGVSGLVGNVQVGTDTSAPGGGIGSTLDALGAPFDVLAGLGLAAVIGIPTILIAILSGLIAAFGVLITLIARRLVLVILVIIAPLAFAAWVLPGTEKYFNMWLKTFVRAVLMYPMIIFLLSAASVASAAVSTDKSQIESLLAAVLPIIAFFMIPMTFKWAGSAMSGTAGFINNRTGRINSSKPMQGLRKGAAERQQRINQNRAAGYQNASVFGQNIPGSRRVLTGLGRIGTGQVLPGSHTHSDIALAAQKAMAEESKRVGSLNLDRGVLRALATGDASGLNGADKAAYDQHKGLSKTYTGRAAVANQMAKNRDVEGLDKFREQLNTDVKNKRLAPTQATQLWNGAKAGAFSDIKAADPIMAVSGWNTGEYDGTAVNPTTGVSRVQESMSRLGGEDVAGMVPGRLKTYANAGVTMTAGQVASATTDKARVGKSPEHQAALHDVILNSVAGGDQQVQHERFIRYSGSGPGGVPAARTDTEVNEIRKLMARDPRDPAKDTPANPATGAPAVAVTYTARVEEAIAKGVDIPLH